MALRASELTGLNVSDVYDCEQVKTHVTIRGETAKFSKGRTIRVWDIVVEQSRTPETAEIMQVLRDW